MEKEFKEAWKLYNENYDGTLYMKIINDEDLKALDTENRWSLSSTINKENISQHSYWVTLFTFIMCKKQGYDDSKTLKAISYSLFHDFDEAFSGDLNHKFKYDVNNGIDRETLKEYGKDKTKEKFLVDFSLPIETLEIFEVEDELKFLVKICDWLSALQFISFEIKMGNRTKKMKEAFLYSMIKTEQIIKEYSIIKGEEKDFALVVFYQTLHDINEQIYKDE